jgi:CRP-like cAMP-binding protein
MIEDLKRSDFFAGFDEHALADIAAFARKVTYEAGTIVFDRDEDARTTWMMLSGRIRQGFEVAPGAEVWFQSAEPCDLVGFDALIAPRVRTMRAKTSEKTEMVEIDADALLEYLETNPRFGFIFMERLLQVVQHRLNNTRLQVIHLMPDKEVAGPTLERD